MLRLCMVGGAFALLTASIPAPIWATTLLSENFNELTPSLAVTSAGAFSTINGTNVDIVGGGLFGYLCVAPESGNCIAMDGSGGNPQGQLQSNMLFAAGSYQLSFDLIGSQRGATAATTVTFGDYNQTFTLSSSDVTAGIVSNQLVTLSSPGYLLFVSDTPGNIGNLLDNVVVSTTTKVVPEPSSLFLVGLALLSGIIVAARRDTGTANR
jgi:hypothetical protein